MLAVINQKGGVGKTTTTLNLAHAMAQRDERVLCIDLDPQAHLTAGFGLLQRPQHGIADLLLGEMTFSDVVLTARECLDLIPAGERLGGISGILDVTGCR